MRRTSGSGFGLGNMSILIPGVDSFHTDKKQKIPTAFHFNKEGDASMMEIDESRANIRDSDLHHLDESMDSYREAPGSRKKSSRFVSLNTSLINYVPVLQVRKQMSPDCSREKSKLSLRDNQTRNLRSLQGLDMAMFDHKSDRSVSLGYLQMLKQRSAVRTKVLGHPTSAGEGFLPQADASPPNATAMARSERLLLKKNSINLAPARATAGSILSVTCSLPTTRILSQKLKPHRGDSPDADAYASPMVSSSPILLEDILKDNLPKKKHAYHTAATYRYRRNSDAKVTVIKVRRTSEVKPSDVWSATTFHQDISHSRPDRVLDSAVGVHNVQPRPTSRSTRTSVLEVFKPPRQPNAKDSPGKPESRYSANDGDNSECPGTPCDISNR